MSPITRVEQDGSPLGEYTYNGLGQRVIKQVGGATTVFQYDFDGNIIAESDAGGKYIYEYLYVVEARIAMVDVLAGNIYSFLNNFNGTLRILTDQDGMVVWEADYKLYGKALVNSNSEVVNNFRFAGQYFDSETGLHYNYHRYYDPSNGRYLRPDPIGLAGGINLYAYVANNPINAIDPQGLVLQGLLIRIAPYLLRLAPWAVPATFAVYDLTYSPTSPGIPQAIDEIERYQERKRLERLKKLKEIDAWIEKQKEILMLGLDTCLEIALEKRNKNCYSEDEWKLRRKLCFGKYQKDWDEIMSPMFKIRYEYAGSY